MKTILIESRVYKIKNADYNLIIESFDDSSDILGVIEDKYKPFVYIDDIFNYH